MSAARRALAIGDVEAHDPVPIFRLCWKMAGNAATVLERGIPDAGPVQARYLGVPVRPAEEYQWWTVVRQWPQLWQVGEFRGQNTDEDHVLLHESELKKLRNIWNRLLF